jgi:hypothetical protein
MRFRSSLRFAIVIAFAALVAWSAWAEVTVRPAAPAPAPDLPKVSVTFRVRDAAGPVKDVGVRLVRDRDDAMRGVMVFDGDLVRPCVTTADGLCTIEMVPGTYVIRLYGPIVQAITGKRTLNEQTRVIDLVVDRGVPLRGHVLFPDGTPAPARSLVALEGLPVIQTATTEADGSFTFPHAPRGKHRVSAQIVGIYPIRSKPVEATAPSDDVVLRVERPGQVSGRVVALPDRTPVSEFEIPVERIGAEREQLDPWNTKRQIVSRKRDGTFSAELPSGLYELILRANGYASQTLRMVRVKSGSTTEVEFVLEPAASIAGKVTDERGAPIEGASIRLLQEERLVPREQATRTDANGDFVANDAPAGEVALEVHRDGYFRKRATTHVVAGQQSRVEVELRAGLEIRGTVIDEYARPLAGATVRVMGSCCNGTAQTEVDGSFVVRGFEDGRYAATVEKKGYVDQTQRFEVPTAALTFMLGRGGTITGFIRGLSAADLRESVIEAQKGGMREFGEIDPATGAFRIESVSDGRATVVLAVRREYRHALSKDVDVHNGIGGPVELDVLGGVTVTGSVMHRGVPVRGSVSFHNRGSSTFFGQSVPIVDGRYRATNIAEGKTTIVVKAENGIFVHQGEIELRGNTEHSIEVSGMTLQGRVRDAHGLPVGDAVVELHDVPRANTRTTVETERDGSFMVSYLPAAHYEIQVEAAGYALRLARVEVVEGRDATVEVTLSSGEPVVLRITDARNGKPMNARVHLVGADQQPLRNDVRFVDGAHRTWLPPGTYTAKVYEPGFAEQVDVPIRVPGADVLIAMRQGGTLVVEARSTLAFQASLIPQPGTRADTHGFLGERRHVLRNIPSGEYVLRIGNDGVRAEAEYAVTIREEKVSLVTIE